MLEMLKPPAMRVALITNVPFTIVPAVLMVLSFVIGLGVGCGQPLSMTLAYNAAPPGRGAEGITMRLAVSYGAHIVNPHAKMILEKLRCLS